MSALSLNESCQFRCSLSEVTKSLQLCNDLILQDSDWRNIFKNPLKIGYLPMYKSVRADLEKTQALLSLRVRNNVLIELYHRGEALGRSTKAIQYEYSENIKSLIELKKNIPESFRDSKKNFDLFFQQNFLSEMGAVSKHKKHEIVLEIRSIPRAIPKKSDEGFEDQYDGIA